jgi:metallophosphoesterase (TIGR00282 family)
VAVVEARNGVSVAVLNLLGQLFLPTPISPWELVDALVEEARAAAPVVVVDFHAEATSEKVAVARWLDGRVTAVIGTHTHVQTADERILPKGTAYLTDAGMTGPHESIIGVTVDAALSRFLSAMPANFESASGAGRLNAVLFTAVQATGRAKSISRLNLSSEEVDTLAASTAAER